MTFKAGLHPQLGLDHLHGRSGYPALAADQAEWHQARRNRDRQRCQHPQLAVVLDQRQRHQGNHVGLLEQRHGQHRRGCFELAGGCLQLGLAENLLVDFPQRCRLRLHDPGIAGECLQVQPGAVLQRMAGARDDLNQLLIELLEVQFVGGPALGDTGHDQVQLVETQGLQQYVAGIDHHCDVQLGVTSGQLRQGPWQQVARQRAHGAQAQGSEVARLQCAHFFVQAAEIGEHQLCITNRRLPQLVWQQALMGAGKQCLAHQVLEFVQCLGHRWLGQRHDLRGLAQ